MSARVAAPLWLLLAALMLAVAACGGPSNLVHAEVNPEEPVALSTKQPVARSGGRPNILVIETDDMRWDELRWMPNVRRMIESTGLDFANSFAPYPLCCPSRASFLTGEYAHNHGVLSTADPFGFQSFDDHRTIATELQKAGYQTALVGKYLNGYGEMPTYGTRRPSLYYVPPGWTEWYGASDHAWPAWQDVHGSTYNYFQLTQNINGSLVTWPGRYSPDVMAGETRHLIGQFASTGKPWFVWWTPISPHRGKPHEADDPPLTPRGKGGPPRFWPTPARPNWVKGRFDRQITHGLGTPANHSAEANTSDKPHWLSSLPPLTHQEKVDETNLSRQRAEALYALDRAIGKTLRYLHSTGQYDDTVIMFTSDNGYYLGEHRKRFGKINLHEPSLRVPLLMTGPGIPHGVRYDPISTVDIAPTIASWAGIPGGMPGADGVDMRPVITGGDRGWRRPVVTEGLSGQPAYAKAALAGKHGFDSALDNRGLRLGRWKLTVYPTGEKELYDLARDPLELHNLWKRPAYAQVLHRMMRLWYRYKDCAQAQCRAPLPRRFQLSPAQERRITLHQVRRTLDWFGDPGLQGPRARTGVRFSGSGQP